MQNNEYLNIINEDDCIGCSACFNKCPTGAIIMGQNCEGFYTPFIDKNKCTNCGLCKKVCPNINVSYQNKENAKCYAAMAKDKIRMNSSSGGIFNLISNFILENNGYVCGACWNEKEWFVEHKIINTKNELIKLQKSKYVQSKIGNNYKEIEKLLKNNETVLFSGTPCQVAGLYSYLGKNYEKLYTIDLVCHGVPSAKIFNDFLNEVGEIADIEKIDFREKELKGWSCSSTTIKYKNQITERTDFQDAFFKGFSEKLFLKRHCSNCLYSKIPRQADITLGDFWGIRKFNKNYTDKKGTSIVVSNNKKGDFLVSKIKKNTILFKEVDFKSAVKKSNPNINGSFKIHKNRDLFFKLYNKYGFKKAFEYAIEDKYDICLINNKDKDTIGSAISKYALLKELEKYTNRVCIANNENITKQEKLFLEKNFTCINFEENNISALEINYKSDKFITTSELNNSNNLLTQIYDNNYKISYGSNLEEYNRQDEKIAKDNLLYLISKLSKISLSQDSKLLENRNINYEKLMNSIFLLDKNQFKNNDITETKCFYYFVDNDDWKNKSIKEIENLVILTTEKENIENFLKKIIDSKYIITDSYYITCLAIVLNKQFLTLNNNIKDYKQLENLLLDLNLRNNLVSSYEDFKEKYEILNKEIDYNNINGQIELEKIKGKDFIKSILEIQKESEIISDNDYLRINVEFQNKLLKNKLLYIRKEGQIKLKHAFVSTLRNFCFGKLKEKLNKKRNEYKKIINLLKY